LIKYDSADDVLENWSLAGVMDPETIAQLRADTIWTEGGAGNIYLKQNADVYECTVEGNVIKDKDDKDLGPEDDTYQTIVRMAKMQASKDDTILRELFG